MLIRVRSYFFTCFYLFHSSSWSGLLARSRAILVCSRSILFQTVFLSRYLRRYCISLGVLLVCSLIHFAAANLIVDILLPELRPFDLCAHLSQPLILGFNAPLIFFARFPRVLCVHSSALLLSPDLLASVVPQSISSTNSLTTSSVPLRVMRWYLLPIYLFHSSSGAELLA